MTWRHPSPALVISLIALFVALGGTSYAAFSLPKNSVGTAQIKKAAVTASKLNSAVLKSYLKVGGTLPSGATETGEWGGGGYAGSGGAGGTEHAVSSFAIPLKAGLDGSHTIFVSSGGVPYCSGPGHAAAGYLCVYGGYINGAGTPSSGDIYNPSASGSGAASTGFGIVLSASSLGYWDASGTYAVTAP